ncbi:MAG: hypothetical protein H6622_06145 [Halobacteriovoraceae bacterium]|nr:hypothetical protein [Halobacteriovoraceae bacterium]
MKLQKIFVHLLILVVCLSCQVESTTEFTEQLFGKNRIEGNGEGVWGLVVSSKPTATPGEIFDVNVSGGQGPYQLIHDREHFEVLSTDDQTFKIKVLEEIQVNNDYLFQVVDSNGLKGETTIRVIEVFLDQSSLVLPTQKRGAGVSISKNLMCVSASSDKLDSNELVQNNGAIIYRKINGSWKFAQSIDQEYLEQSLKLFEGQKPDYYASGGGGYQRLLGFGNCYVNGEFLILSDETTIFKEDSGMIDSRGMFSLFKWDSATQKFILKQLIYPESILEELGQYANLALRNKIYFKNNKLIFPLYSGTYSYSDKIMIYNLENEILKFDQLIKMDRTYSTLGDRIELSDNFLAISAKPNKWYQDKKYGVLPRSVLIYKKGIDQIFQLHQKIFPPTGSYTWSENSFGNDLRFNSNNELFVSHPNSIQNGVVGNIFYRYKLENDFFQVLESIPVRADQFVITSAKNLFIVNFQDKTIGLYDYSSKLMKIHEVDNILFKYSYTTNGFYNTYSVIDYSDGFISILSGENLLQMIGLE